LQAGAAMALRLPQEWFSEQNKVYLRRKEEILKLATALKCSFTEDQTGLFLWCRVPKGTTSEGFVDHLLKQYHIFVAPGFIFGSQGEGFIRFSLCSPEEIIIEACKRLAV
ncbi:aminotransferase class I/II-fold pyridoxal phosphate-dependent enzyme, partial [Tamlana crocina]